MLPSARAHGPFNRRGRHHGSLERSGHGRGTQGDAVADPLREHVHEIGDSGAQLVVLEVEESVDQEAAVRRRRKFGQRRRFDLAVALGLWYRVVKISDVNFEESQLSAPSWPR